MATSTSAAADPGAFALAGMYRDLTLAGCPSPELLRVLVGELRRRGCYDRADAAPVDPAAASLLAAADAWLAAFAGELAMAPEDLLAYAGDYLDSGGTPAEMEGAREEAVFAQNARAFWVRYAVAAGRLPPRLNGVIFCGPDEYHCAC
jgi:hypothetical protein